MADSYVCSGATMRCTMGEKPAKLTVLPSRTVFLCNQPPMANITDNKSMVNLAPFGRCRSLGYPATAAATAAHHGHLTPMPCVHNTPDPWIGGKMDYLTKGQPALLKSSICCCKWGGVISIIDDGQNGESPDIEKQQKDVYDKRQSDRIIIVDAYWEKQLKKDGKKQNEATKLRFLPQLEESVRLIIVFYYEYDNDILYDKEKAKIKIEIPGTCLDGAIDFLIPQDSRNRTSEVFEGHVLYKASINGFTFDLRPPAK